MHRIDQHFRVLRIGVLVNAMAQIEHMAIAAAKFGQDARHFLLYRLRRAK